MERAAGLTPADRKWMDDIVTDVNEGWDEENPMRSTGIQYVPVIRKMRMLTVCLDSKVAMITFGPRQALSLACLVNYLTVFDSSKNIYPPLWLLCGIEISWPRVKERAL